MACPIVTSVTDIERTLEGYIIEWSEKVLHNDGLMRSVETIYPHDSIVEDVAAAKVSLYAMTSEIARIKYGAKPLYTATLPKRNDVNAKLQLLCGSRETHEANRNAWISYRAGLDPLDPNYETKYDEATDKINENDGYYNTKVSQISQLETDANVILGAINTEFTELAAGVLKAMFTSNKSVGTEIVEEFTDASPFAYVIRTLSKFRTWSQFSGSLDTVNKIQSIDFNTQLLDGEGQHEAVTNLLSARDDEFVDNQLVVNSDMDFKEALIEGYGNEMINNVSSARDDIDGEYAFLQQLLITTTSGQTVTYDPAAYPSWTTGSATFEITSWYYGKIDELDVLPDAYDPYDDPFVPVE